MAHKFNLLRESGSFSMEDQIHRLIRLMDAENFSGRIIALPAV